MLSNFIITLYKSLYISNLLIMHLINFSNIRKDPLIHHSFYFKISLIIHNNFDKSIKIF
jgi:hypothetical protein